MVPIVAGSILEGSYNNRNGLHRGGRIVAGSILEGSYNGRASRSTNSTIVAGSILEGAEILFGAANTGYGAASFPAFIC